MQGGTGLCKSNDFNRITMITWLWMPLYISTAQVRQLCQMVPRPTKIFELITVWCSHMRIIKYCSWRNRINNFMILPAYWFPRPLGRKISQTGWMLSRARSSYLTRSRTLEKYIYHFHKYSSEFIILESNWGPLLVMLTMFVLPFQKLMSFLNARKSNNRCTADTANVTINNAMFVSAKIPFTSSVSFSWSYKFFLRQFEFSFFVDKR